MHTVTVVKYTLVLTCTMYNAGRYRIHLVFNRKTTANRNQTGLKYTPVFRMLGRYRIHLVLQKETNANRNQTGLKYTLVPYNAGIETVWYLEEH